MGAQSGRDAERTLYKLPRAYAPSVGLGDGGAILATFEVVDGGNMRHAIVEREERAPGMREPTRVTADEVLARLTRGEPLIFVDARREEEWQTSNEKLSGAFRVSPEAHDEDETLPLLPRGRSIITYCTCPHEASAARVAELLMARGYTDVHVLYSGPEAWRRAGGTFSPK